VPLRLLLIYAVIAALYHRMASEDPLEQSNREIRRKPPQTGRLWQWWPPH